MIAKLICTEAIRQRPAMRARTSRSASSPDSPLKRRTSSGERPIVLPSRMPETDSDSSTSVDMSARRLWRTDWMRRRSSPTRRVSQTKNGSSTSENAARRQSSSTIATTVAIDRRDVLDDRGRGRGDDAVDAADVVGDARLHLARARVREERQRHALQVRVDGRAQVVHHALADLVGDPRLRDADHARDDRQRDHPRDELDHQRRVVLRVGLVDEFPQQERADHAEPGRQEDQRQQQAEPRPVGREQPAYAAQRDGRRRGCPRGAAPAAASGVRHPERP